jgi:hypothetical protein
MIYIKLLLLFICIETIAFPYEIEGGWGFKSTEQSIKVSSTLKDAGSGHNLRVSFLHLLGDDESGFLLGGGFKAEENQYVFGTRYPEYRYSSCIFQFGYSKLLAPKQQIRFFLEAGLGSFEFEKHDQSKFEKSNVVNAGFEALYYYNWYENFSPLGGISIVKTFVPDFDYDGRSMRSQDFTTKFHLLFGLNYRF